MRPVYSVLTTAQVNVSGIVTSVLGNNANTLSQKFLTFITQLIKPKTQ